MAGTCPSRTRPSCAERRLRGVVDSVGDAILSADADSRIVSWNAAATRMFGWTAEEAIGSELTMLMPERYRAGAPGRRRAARSRPASRSSSAAGRSQLEGLRKDGTEFPIELTLGVVERPRGRALHRRRARHLRPARARALPARAGRGRGRAGGRIDGRGGGDRRAARRSARRSAGRSARCGSPAEDERRAALRGAVARAGVAGARRSRSSSRTLTLERGVGLPGRVWESGEPLWIDDFSAEPSLPRHGRRAARPGCTPRSACRSLAEGGAIGVLEFFDHEVRRPTPDVVAPDPLAERAGRPLPPAPPRRGAARGVQKELARRRDSERHAQEINSHVIHHLVQASEALDAGDLRRAQAEMRRTLEEACRIVTDLGLWTRTAPDRGAQGSCGTRTRT